VDGNTVVMLRMNEAAGTTADDASTNNRDGTLNNMLGTEWTAGKLNNCLAFDGSNDYVGISDDAVLDPASFTAEFWVNLDSTANGQGLCAKRDGSNNGFDFTTTGNGKIQFSVDTGAGNDKKATSSTQLNSGTWYHVAGTYDGTNLKIYIDGALEATTANSGDWTNGESIYMGSLKSTAYMGGKIDDFRFSNIARTSFPHVGGGGTTAISRVAWK
jgi:hypothetical protein